MLTMPVHHFPAFYHVKENQNYLLILNECSSHFGLQYTVL